MIDGCDVNSKKHIEIAALIQKGREKNQMSLLLWRHNKSIYIFYIPLNNNKYNYFCISHMALINFKAGEGMTLYKSGGQKHKISIFPGRMFVNILKFFYFYRILYFKKSILEIFLNSCGSQFSNFKPKECSKVIRLY